MEDFKLFLILPKKSRDGLYYRTAGPDYSFCFTGKTVMERSAMQMTAVYSCVRILSEAIVRLPLHLYKYIEDGGK